MQARPWAPILASARMSSDRQCVCIDFVGKPTVVGSAGQREGVTLAPAPELSQQSALAWYSKCKEHHEVETIVNWLLRKVDTGALLLPRRVPRQKLARRARKSPTDELRPSRWGQEQYTYYMG